MTLDEFRATLTAPKPLSTWPAALRALWLDASGDWDAAHGLVDDPADAIETRVHAYLHRKEGDPSNARYWYAQAGVKPWSGALEREWESLVRELLGA